MAEQHHIITKRVEIKVGVPGSEKVPGIFARIGQSIKDMNKAASASGLGGEGSIFSILKGGGLAVGAKFGLDALANAASSMRELAEGTLSFGQALLKAGEGVPLIGSFFTMLKEGAGALDALGNRLSGAAEAAKYQSQYARTKGEVASADLRFGGAVAALGGKAAGIGLNEPEKMRLAARQEWLAAGKEIEQLTKEADALARKQLSLYFGVFRGGPGADDRRREYDLVSYQLQRQRAQIEQMEKFRAELRTEANKQAADVETRIVGEFYGGLATAARGAMERTAATGFNLMNQLGARLMQQKAEREEYRKDFMYQMQQDTIEFERIKEQELEEFEAGTSGGAPISRYAPAVEGRFLTGAGGGNGPDAQTAKNTAEISRKQDTNTEAIRDLARAIREGRGEVVYLR